MNNVVRKKTILCLLDCVPKSVDEIAGEIDESLETIADSLTILISESICEKVSTIEVSQYTVRKDIGSLRKLTKEFLSNVEEHKQDTEQFISSEYYHSGIDDRLVNSVLARFHLASVYRTDEERLGLRRLLLASPSALFHVLHADTQIFDEMWSSQNQLDTSDSTRQWFGQILVSQFQTPILDMLRADMNSPVFAKLHAVLGLRAVKISTHVSLATMHGNYAAAGGGGSFSLGRAMENLRAGQLVSNVDPMAIANDGLAFLHLEEFHIALEYFDKAINMLQDPMQKAKVWNNMGVTFLLIKQYQKAIQCFTAGIELDSKGEFAPLCENKRLAEEHLANATENHNFTQTTQIRYFQGHIVPLEETRFFEFKEVSGKNPVSSIENTADEYAVAFLNREGGRLFWGIRDSDRTTIGVTLDHQNRNEVRQQVSQKLGQIQPPISFKHWKLHFHAVHNANGQSIPNLWVIELVIFPPKEGQVFFTGSSELFVKTDGGKRKLIGQQITEHICSVVQSDTKTE
ncbi:MAG: putative DNA binding domain-containing protein [Candidatus Poribacteria bacterium]|nr:putative DNA binding domain-containing protein [Candidatus Poribacteria bacterium]